jgi:hypothetical protein
MNAPWTPAVARKQGLPRSISDGSLAEVRPEGVPLQASEITAPESVKQSFGSSGRESLTASAPAPALDAQ